MKREITIVAYPSREDRDRDTNPISLETVQTMSGLNKVIDWYIDNKPEVSLGFFEENKKVDYSTIITSFL